ncbi:MAG: alpha/beta hydrolase [Bacteroidota bacterium]
MKQRTINNFDIHYSDQGSGPVLVFVHGFCEDYRIWEQVSQAVEGYRIVSIDLPGFGRSEALAEPSVEGMAEVLRGLLEELDIDRFLLIGHSMGGYVSLAFAERHGAQLEGLALVHSHPYADTEETKVARDRSIQFIRDNGHSVYVRQLMLKLFPADFAQRQPAIIDLLSERASGYSVEGIIGGLQAMRDRADRSSVLSQLSVPVLFIVGEEDMVVPAASSKAQTALPAVADIQILEGIGHMLMFENPAHFHRLINNFLVFCQQFALSQDAKTNR